MHRINPNLLASKFRGTLLGVLVGDCCGLPFEFDGINNAQTGVIKENLNKLEGEYFKAPLKKYSDDTAMTKVLAATLVDGYDQKKLAKNFVKEYFNEPSRGYGTGVHTVFQKLKGTKFSNVTGPASEQFLGSGSFGNGGAMRISPAALYCWKNVDQLDPLVDEITKITHTHRIGIVGAHLQAQAVSAALLLDPTTATFNIHDFYNKLLTKIEEIEKNYVDDLAESKNEYQTQLKEMYKLLCKEQDPTMDEVVNVLGHSISALYSVPTAIYCFLRSQKRVAETQNEAHPFRNTLEYAIGLGGDTDTITSMSCAIAGAYYGDSVLSENLLKHCEGVTIMKELADKLYNKVGNT